MNKHIKKFVDKLPHVRRLREQVAKQGIYPAGHYHSPIPNKEDVIRYLDCLDRPMNHVSGINLNSKAQLKLIHEYSKFYSEIPFQENKTEELRFYYNNRWYSYGDAVFLYSFLRKHEPKKIIEVGSGFSSAVMLDTIDLFLKNRPEITFVEPYPDRLHALLRNDDEHHVKILDSTVQHVPVEIFSDLEAGDLLFIDSSHVVKCGSDLHYLFYEVIPNLPLGCFVHFHDVFYPFGYPSDWLEEGRYWNENYFLHAFLSYNSEWSIYFFNTYAAFAHGEFLEKEMPLCYNRPGGGLYIQRDGKGYGSS